MKSLRRKPTDAELAILRVLWSRGPSTVRQVAEDMGREGGYTTVLKLLQIMTEKRLVRRDEWSRTHVYEGGVSQDHTERQVVTDLLDRVFAREKPAADRLARRFDRCAAKLVPQALAAKKAGPEELDEIKKLIAARTGG